MDEKLGRMVTRVVLPRVVMHSRHHFGVFDSYFPTIFVYYEVLDLLICILYVDYLISAE